MTSTGTLGYRTMLSLNRELIAENIRKARKRAGLTQAALAEAADISTETISRIERGAFDASLATMVALADALGVNVDYLVGRTSRAEKRASTSPVVERLAARAELLPVAAQRTLLQLAEMLPEKLSLRTRKSRR